MKTLLTITGKSCTGKSTLEADLARELGYSKAVSHTTRHPRIGEVEGQHYYFVSHAEFEERHDNGEFVETNSFNGNGYAVSVKELDTLAEKGRPVILIVDPNGHDQIVKWIEQNPNQGWRHISIYLVLPTDQQCDRFLKRSLPELISADERKLTSVVNRMTAMMVDEKDWDKRCLKSDLFFVLQYKPENEKSVRRSIEFIISEDYFANPESAGAVAGSL